jgi:large subunit ribosomal protein L23
VEAVKQPYEIIQIPYLTEKAGHQQELLNKVAFKVDVNANKIEIKQAVEKIFNVKVSSVRVMNYQGKVKRVRFRSGSRAAWKKAICTLQPGSTIDFLGSK